MTRSRSAPSGPADPWAEALTAILVLALIAFLAGCAAWAGACATSLATGHGLGAPPWRAFQNIVDGRPPARIWPHVPAPALATCSVLIYDQVQDRFGNWPDGITCWDRHAWNPASDHPRGRACDFTVGRLGHRPDARTRARGWRLADWACANAVALGISYVIFDGRIWSRQRDSRGWRPYDGGGVYDPASVTGGHYDHVHISVT